MRVFRAFVASVVINLVLWTVAPWLGRTLHREAPETVAVTTTRIRIEHRAPPTPIPQPRATPRRTAKHGVHRHGAPAGPVAPPMTATLLLPPNWKTTYMGSARVNDRDVRLWLDWSDQSAEFVPRVFLWRRAIDAMDPREVTLRVAVAGVLAQLKDEGGVKFYASRPERVCNGRYPGWFLSYDKLDGDPHIHIDDLLLVANNFIYRATYVRTLDVRESPKTVAAMRSLC
ncbi:MAG TPA: hypothetical protein VMB20_13840 [Candidatus Acidoferrum sp.]|nr:hypothetical protein [Candidatus Acidoferrum sp.]